MTYDMDAPWNASVKGDQVLPLINADDACIRVEAGPGTGKTFGLKQRVLRLLLPTGKGVSHKSILVVAFNRVIAADLRQSIRERLEQSEYKGQLPRIATLHSFCLDHLGLHTRVLLPHEQDAMAYDLVTACPQLNDTYDNHSKILKALRLLQAGFSDDQLLKDQAHKWLIRHHAGDIGDVPLMLLSAIKGGDYESLRFDHVVVDEFQDLTQTEQELVFQLVKSGGSVVVLGDPRQSIYRFRGNEREGLSNLGSLTTMAVTDYPMTECQRCPPRFVDLANTTQVSSSANPLSYGNDGDDNTHVVFWATPAAEAKGMAKAIVSSVKENTGEKHLVMATRRAFGYLLRDELLALEPDLLVNMVFSESPLETWPVREAFIAFCLLTDPDGPTWRSWFGFRTRVRTTSPKEEMAPKRNSAPYLDLLTKTSDSISLQALVDINEGRLTVAGSGSANVVERASRMLNVHTKYKALLEDPEALVEKVFCPEAWLPAGPDDPESVKNDFEVMRQLTAELLAEVQTGSAAERLRDVARKLRAHIAARDTNCLSDEDPQVTIATLWSAKGVTADHVYVLGLCKEAIPGKKRDEYPGTDVEYHEEQQRLFYVTVTRSKRTLVLSRPQKVKRGDAPGMGLFVQGGGGHWATLQISPFLLSVQSKLPQAVAGASWAGCT